MITSFTFTRKTWHNPVNYISLRPSYYMRSTNKAHRSALILLCAGEGRRLGFPIPKAYIPLRGAPLYVHAMHAFKSIVDEKDCYLVVGAQHTRFIDHIKAAFPLAHIIQGGAERVDSVLAGLSAARNALTSYTQYVIHDACRPFPTKDMIFSAIDAIENKVSDAVCPALPVIDSLKGIDGNQIVLSHVPRQDFILAQTPQILSPHAVDVITGSDLSSQNIAHANITDDLALVAYLDMPTSVTQGDPDAMKLTTQDDYASLIRIHDKRKNIVLPASVSSSGFDAHAFGEEGSAKHIMLGGITVPHDRVVIGHSDGDVVLHAITDALLGCVAARDIGYHFSSSGSDWKDADSSQFLLYALNIMRLHAYIPDYTAITIIAQQPVLSPYLYVMQSRVAELLYGDSSTISRVSIQATTTDHLGFTGRKEGLFAYAHMNARRAH